MITFGDSTAAAMRPFPAALKAELAAQGRILDRHAWTDEELSAAKARHPAAERLDDVAALLEPTHPRMVSAMLFRPHSRELLDRIAAGGDTRPGTAVEGCLVLCAISLRAPLNATATGLYLRLWAVAGLPDVGNGEALAYYEATAGSLIDDAENLLRTKTRQMWRALR